MSEIGGQLRHTVAPAGKAWIAISLALGSWGVVGVTVWLAVGVFSQFLG